MFNYSILSPKNKNEFDDYYYFRWKYLRKPLNKKLGTEKDDIEDRSIHKMVINKEGLIIAVGRIHRLSNISSQIRYFAVDRDYRKQGIGTYLMNHLEKVSLDEKRPCMILNARENAVSFYKKLDYHITEKSNLLYGKIQHYRMKKKIQSNKIY